MLWGRELRGTLERVPPVPPELSSMLWGRELRGTLERVPPPPQNFSRCCGCCGGESLSLPSTGTPPPPPLRKGHRPPPGSRSAASTSAARVQPRGCKGLRPPPGSRPAASTSAARVQPRGCKGRSPLHKKTKIFPLPAGKSALRARTGGWGQKLLMRQKKPAN